MELLVLMMTGKEGAAEPRREPAREASSAHEPRQLSEERRRILEDRRRGLREQARHSKQQAPSATALMPMFRPMSSIPFIIFVEPGGDGDDGGGDGIGGGGDGNGGVGEGAGEAGGDGNGGGGDGAGGSHEVLLHTNRTS